MSKHPSPKQSSNGSAAELIRVVEQLIDSDEEEKNIKKMTVLKAQFPVLKKMHPFMTNQQKLQLFLRDPIFRNRAQQKLMEQGIYMPYGIPILKVYLISIRYGASVNDQFQQNDLIGLFQRFGILTNFYCTDKFAFISYQQIISAYLATKTLNQFYISEYVRLCVKWCSQDEGVEAQSLFEYAKIGGSNIVEGTGASIKNQNIIMSEKYIVKFLFEVQILPQFNIAQRIIGPRGNYLKNIMNKVLNQQPDCTRKQIPNIDSLLKIRLRGKGSGFQQNIHSQAEQKMHLFVSSRSKNIQQQACQEIEKLLFKVFQEYKIHYQKIYRKHSEGIAYRVFHFEGSFFIEVRQLLLKEIETNVDILAMESQGKLPQSVIETKIKQRQRLRKNGRFQEADEIRDWLKSRGVKLVDSKVRGRKCTWSYEMV